MKMRETAIGGLRVVTVRMRGLAVAAAVLAAAGVAGAETNVTGVTTTVDILPGVTAWDVELTCDTDWLATDVVAPKRTAGQTKETAQP